MSTRLREQGHDVHVVTFSGLGSSQPDCDAVGLETHVQDALGHIERSALRDVCLVGHSYSGLVAGLVADRAPHLVQRTVYVQGFLPVQGESLLDAFPDEQRAQELADIDAHDGRWPPPSAEAIAAEPDLSPEQVRWLVERLVSHPARTVSEPVALSTPLADQPSTYIASSMTGRALDSVRSSPRWEFRGIRAGHWPMLTVPDQLARMLIDATVADPRGEIGR